MRIPRLFTEASLQRGQSVQLEEKASHHLTRVLRHRAGDRLTLFNGDGYQYSATLQSIEKKQATVTIGAAETVDTESPLNTHLGIAVSKGDRFDWVIQKATELGVTTITPLTTARTEFKLDAERQQKKWNHWRQVSISACEQCGRNRLVDLQPITSLGAWLPSVNAERKLVLDHRADPTPPVAATPASAALLIGPEGGLGAEEIDRALAAGFSPLQLGPRVLRTETAPVAALTLVQHLWGDL